MNKLLIGISFVLVLGLFSFQDASAVITVFNDKTTFLTTTSATSATGALPNLGALPGGAAGTATVGTVTFTITPPSSQLFIGGGSGPDWTPLNPGNDIAISDVENLNADLAAPVFALGFDFVEPTSGIGAGTGFTDTTFSVTLKNGAVIVDSFQFNSPDDVLAFVGVLSDTSFDRVEIRDITATNDDEFWGEFYTSSISPGCTVFPDMVDAGVLAFGASHEVSKGIQCFGGIGDVDPDVSDCASHRIDVSFNDPPIIDEIGFWWMEETIVNNNSIPGKTTCTVLFNVDFDESSTTLTQTIMVTTPAPTIVGGELIPIETTSLLLASAQSFSWMIPVILSGIGIGIAIFSKRDQKNL